MVEAPQGARVSSRAVPGDAQNEHLPWRERFFARDEGELLRRCQQVLESGKLSGVRLSNVETGEQLDYATAQRRGDEQLAAGTLVAERSARLSPRVDGLVRTLQVDAGDRVKRGDVLLRLAE